MTPRRIDLGHGAWVDHQSGWLKGHQQLMDQLVSRVRWQQRQRSMWDRVVLEPAARRRILSVLDKHDLYLQHRKDWGFDEVIQYGRGMVMLFHGEPGTGKTMTAHAIAHHLGKKVLNVDIPTFVDHANHDRFLPALFREARVRDAVLFLAVTFERRGITSPRRRVPRESRRRHSRG